MNYMVKKLSVLGIFFLVSALFLSGCYFNWGWGDESEETPEGVVSTTPPTTSTINTANQATGVDLVQVIKELFAVKYNRDVSTIRVTIQKQTTNFAMGGVVMGNEGGGMFYAARTGKGWVIAQDGNGTPSCKVLKSYNFPQDMMTHCADVPVPTQTTPASQADMDFSDAVKITFCTAEQKAATVCAQIYSQTCGWFNSSVKCIKYPCAQNFSNVCDACANPQVESWSVGACPLQ